MGSRSKEHARLRIRRRLPRPETALLLLAFICTAGAKLLVLHRHQPSSLLATWAEVTVSDVTFFAALAVGVAVAYALRPGRLIARLALILGGVVLGWSAANAAWLLVTGVQLQPGVILVVLHNPVEYWPTVWGRALGHLAVSIPAGLALVVTGAWLIWRLVRPVPVVRYRRRHVLRATAFAAVLTGSGLVQVCSAPRSPAAPSGQVLVFSSHAHALASLLVDSTPSRNAEGQSRSLPRIGQRKVEVPQTGPTELPNIVVVMLESVSYAASGLGDPERSVMPNLARLAATGVEFTNTYVPVSQTGKAFWTMLSGTIPDIYYDYSEAVLVDEPYEGLPSLLRRAGYRSAFFEMSQGSFECAPGTFANFAFDWAWFRENLEDPAAHLGYFSGDDFRLLDPAFKWATQDDKRFFLMMITSVAHDPYELPTWFAPPKQDDYERYIQSVQYTDAFLGEVCQRLTQLGLDKNTLLCVLGDHGDSFHPEARHVRWVPYEEVIRIPWVIHWPGHVPAGLRCAWPCSQTDVTPTVLSLLGYGIAEAGFDGRNAMTPSDPDRKLCFSTWFEGSPLGYVQGSRKWLYWPRSGEVFEYDLDSDPGERSPRLVTAPESDQVIAELMKWEQDSYIVFDAKRFRKRFLFGHWWAFSSGRYARAYYVP
ncbi:MAG TPA: LTA synthase family protein [Phycisphaerae bacterium]|nr:LTA synthase family protein [Phycisphaerae bacterium]